MPCRYSLICGHENSNDAGRRTSANDTADSYLDAAESAKEKKMGLIKLGVNAWQTHLASYRNAYMKIVRMLLVNK